VAERAWSASPRPAPRHDGLELSGSTDTSVALANILKQECAGGEDGSFVPYRRVSGAPDVPICALRRVLVAIAFCARDRGSSRNANWGRLDAGDWVMIQVIGMEGQRVPHGRPVHLGAGRRAVQKHVSVEQS
jgi:hypothetical protein